MSINYSSIPEHCQDGLKRYIEDGIPPGSFLTAVLENNLVEAFGRADHINRDHIRDYCMWLYNEAPAVPRSWGSREIVSKWIKAGGLNGLKRETSE